jgi:predicted dehydrogenase/threonine dehydrogenase-like Zn-dependent dehydrogenase
MIQILQNLSSGRTELAEIPIPRVRAGHLLIKTSRTLISAGTERMLLEFGKASLIDKARAQPDRVRQVLDKIRTDGVLSTLDSVRAKLDQPIPLGYCNAGVVMEVGFGVEGFKVGDRVVSNGPHAEVVCVPKNLCVKIPDAVSDESAAFTVAASIALQGIRLLEPTLGECFVVTGLGLIGLLAVQILKAHGCRVLGIDYDASKVALAERFGVEAVRYVPDEDVLGHAATFSRGKGVDGVLITAASKSSDPVHQAALMCRKRGRIVLTGVTGLELSRDDFYKKELSFQVSCSYGPGRYDVEYEEKGIDYPFSYVRWTEGRNFEAVLDLLASGAVDIAPLISHRFPLERAAEAYDLLAGGREPYLGIVLTYKGDDSSARNLQRTVRLKDDPTAQTPALGNRRNAVRVGMIGAGNYAGKILIPAFRRAKVELVSIASSGGVSGYHFGKKNGFLETTTDINSLFEDERINTVVIATRHDSHARLVCRALAAGKNVFVEKPLALTQVELDEIESEYREISGRKGTAPLLMVGFNRRFAPHIRKIKALLDTVKEPKTFIMTVNAGAVPQDHWTRDKNVGGGRIIGEACHFVDLLRFLAGRPLTGWKKTAAGEDTATITISFEDGSMGTVHYFANGHRSFPKESLEVFCAGKILRLDNFRRLKGFGWTGADSVSFFRQDKGQTACVEEFVEALRNGLPSPIPFDELLEVGRLMISMAD